MFDDYGGKIKTFMKINYDNEFLNAFNAENVIQENLNENI